MTDFGLLIVCRTRIILGKVSALERRDLVTTKPNMKARRSGKFPLPEPDTAGQKQSMIGIKYKAVS
jgi:hypothetical protein